MPLIQGGPPEWIWERKPEMLKWEIVTPNPPNGETVYELRVQCGLEIMRLHFFTEDEVKDLEAVIDQWLNQLPNKQQAESMHREEAVVSDPDFAAQTSRQ